MPDVNDLPSAAKVVFYLVVGLSMAVWYLRAFFKEKGVPVQETQLASLSLMDAQPMREAVKVLKEIATATERKAMAQEAQTRTLDEHKEILEQMLKVMRDSATELAVEREVARRLEGTKPPHRRT